MLRARRRQNNYRLQQEKFWLNIKKKNLCVLWSNNRNRLVQRGCGTSTLGNFQVMTGHGPEQHSLTSDLVLLWAGGWLRSVILIDTWVKCFLHCQLPTNASWDFQCPSNLVYNDNTSGQCMDEYPSLLQPSPKSFQNRVCTAPSSLPSDSSYIAHAAPLSKNLNNGSVMPSRNLIQPPNKKRSQNSGGFLSSSCAKYDSGSECFKH